jgi:hypothetical protein
MPSSERNFLCLGRKATGRARVVCLYAACGVYRPAQFLQRITTYAYKTKPAQFLQRITTYAYKTKPKKQ